MERASVICKTEECEEWTVQPKPVMLPLPRGQVVATFFGDDGDEAESSISVPFMQLTRSQSGGDEPASVKFFDVDCEGRTCRFRRDRKAGLQVRVVVIICE